MTTVNLDQLREIRKQKDQAQKRLAISQQNKKSKLIMTRREMRLLKLALLLNSSFLEQENIVDPTMNEADYDAWCQRQIQPESA